MNRKQRIAALLVVSIVALSMIAGCSDVSQSDPKSTVIAMFGAMEKNDEAALAHLLDMKALMSNVDEDYALDTDEPRILTNPKQILDDLTNDGETKKRWFSYQRIVNKVEIDGSSATVEVSFIDKAKSVGYRTLFGLHITNGKWKIYSFKTMTDSKPASDE